MSKLGKSENPFSSKFCSIAEARAAFFLHGYSTIEHGEDYCLMQGNEDEVTCCVVKIAKKGFLEVDVQVQERYFVDEDE